MSTSSDVSFCLSRLRLGLGHTSSGFQRPSEVFLYGAFVPKTLELRRWREITCEHLATLNLSSLSLLPSFLYWEPRNPRSRINSCICWPLCWCIQICMWQSFGSPRFWSILLVFDFVISPESPKQRFTCFLPKQAPPGGVIFTFHGANGKQRRTGASCEVGVPSKQTLKNSSR